MVGKAYRFTHVGKAQRNMVSAALRRAFIQPDRASASQALYRTVDQIRAKWPKLAGDGYRDSPEHRSYR